MNGAPSIAPALRAVNLKAAMVALHPSPAAWDDLEAAVTALVAWHMTQPDGDAPPPPIDVPFPGLG